MRSLGEFRLTDACTCGRLCLWSGRLKSPFWLLLVGGALLTACAHPTSQSDSEQQGMSPPISEAAGPGGEISQQGTQTILKLRDSTIDPRSRQTIERLSAAAKSTIVYVRPMSGDAHVVRIRPIPPTTYEDALQGIRESGLVDYVERDAIMKALPSR